MTLEAGWMAVALSASVEPGTSTGTFARGAEIVVWRDNSGAAHVWEDRCPHRGMRMSFGFVRGDHIACLYHGWQYDAAGQCRLIPAHPALDVPKTIKVPTYAARENYGIIWATAAVDAAFPEVDGAADVTPLRSLSIDCRADCVLEALGKAGWSTLGGDTGFLPVEGDTLLVAVQAALPERTVLHMVMPGVSATSPDAVARQKRHARWAESFRYAVENATDAVAEFA